AADVQHRSGRLECHEAPFRKNPCECKDLGARPRSDREDARARRQLLQNDADEKMQTVLDWSEAAVSLVIVSGHFDAEEIMRSLAHASQLLGMPRTHRWGWPHHCGRTPRRPRGMHF